MAKRTRPLNADPQFVSPVQVTNQTPSTSTANVEFVRPELAKMVPAYNKIRDCIDGEPAIKRRRTEHLPMPEADVTTPANLARYENYLTRAVFYNVTRQTLAGLIGQVFAVDPVIEVPPLMDPVVKDATGSGVSLLQLAKRAENLVTAYGRLGLLADFPATDEPTTRAQQLAGEIHPTLTVYNPWDVINWRTVFVGRKVKLSLVVLRETYDAEDDGFETKVDYQYRVLKLIDNKYVVEIWRSSTPGGSGYSPVPEMTYYPKDSRGNQLDEIPFTFIGAEDNDPDVDAAPLYDIASLNLAHYRNSADYEENVYFLGQATPYFTGLSEEWVKTVLGGRIPLGSRESIPLPEGATAGLLQVEPNTLAKEAMDQKERQMVALGAKLVQQSEVQRTATETNAENAAEASTLTSITKNVSAGFQWGLEWCAIFAGALTIREDAVDADKRKVKFELNTDFAINHLSAEQINSIIETWLKEGITTEEMRKRLREGGAAYMTDEQYEKSIKKAQEAALPEVDPLTGATIDPRTGLPIEEPEDPDNP